MGISRYEKQLNEREEANQRFALGDEGYRLFKGAPDLLAAATHALEDLQALQTGQYTIDEISGVLIELRCAITKAKGGE